LRGQTTNPPEQGYQLGSMGKCGREHSLVVRRATFSL
jgi:hypothetical protein